MAKSWNISKIWEGGECWIIGGGPSMPGQFNVPDDVINKVRAGDYEPSAYSPYLSPIHDKHVIGVNTAFLIGNWIDLVFFGDQYNFFIPFKRQLSRFKGLRVTTHPTPPEEYDWVLHVPRDRSKRKGLSPLKNKVCWNGNSGAAAIDLAVHMGARRIILLGFDMNDDSQTPSHWHTKYGNRKRSVSIANHKRHKQCFPYIARDAKKRGIEIINANPNSAIDAFMKVKAEELL